MPVFSWNFRVAWDVCATHMKSRPIVSFFVLAFAFTWLVQLPALLAHAGIIAGPPEKYLALVGLGAFGPMAAAMVCSPRDLRALFRPLAAWRANPIWYAASLLVPGAIFVAAAALYNLAGHSEPLFYLPDQPAFVLALFVFSFGEEIGWRGFALPRLSERFGPLAASVIIGFFWALWHIPMLTLQGVPLSPSLYAVFVAYMIGASVFLTWIMGRTRGSLIFVMLGHAGGHLNNSGHALPGHATPIVLHAIAYVVLAAALVSLHALRPIGHTTPVPPRPQ